MPPCQVPWVWGSMYHLNGSLFIYVWNMIPFSLLLLPPHQTIQRHLLHNQSHLFIMQKRKIETYCCCCLSGRCVEGLQATGITTVRGKGFCAHHWPDLLRARLPFLGRTDMTMCVVQQTRPIDDRVVPWGRVMVVLCLFGITATVFKGFMTILREICRLT